MAGIPIDVLLARTIPAEPAESCELEDGLVLEKGFIERVEREFEESAEGILEMLDLSHLKVSPVSEN